MSMVMDLDEYGVDVAVEAPPADQVADMNAVLGGTSENGSSGYGSVRPDA